MSPRDRIDPVGPRRYSYCFSDKPAKGTVSEAKTMARAAGVEERTIETVRHFNRFYVRQLGFLNEGIAHSPFSLTEVRVMYELSLRTGVTASELGRELGLDAGYLSRILRRFQDAGYLVRRPLEGDARQVLLALTDEGRVAYAEVDADVRAQMVDMVGGLSRAEQERLCGAMTTVRVLLQGGRAGDAPLTLRDLRAGDMGWVVQRHGELYEREHGWGVAFEGLVAGVAARFLREADPARERGWIAERGRERVGSVFVMRDTDDVARLRLLLVEPSARGQGVGARLVQEAVRFAREAGYARMALWTDASLHTARRLYEAAGFTLEREEPHTHFGSGQIGQEWSRAL